MPRRRTLAGRGRKKGQVLKWLRTAVPKMNAFMRKHKLVSRAGTAAIASGYVPAKYMPGLIGATGVASKLGYGRRGRTRGTARSYRGRGLRLAGARYY